LTVSCIATSPSALRTRSRSRLNGTRSFFEVSVRIGWCVWPVISGARAAITYRRLSVYGGPRSLSCRWDSVTHSSSSSTLSILTLSRSRCRKHVPNPECHLPPITRDHYRPVSVEGMLSALLGNILGGGLFARVLCWYRWSLLRITGYKWIWTV
jgi:hypothetical protein